MSDIIFAAISALICAAAISVFAKTFDETKKNVRLVFLRAFCVSLFVWAFSTALLYIVPDRNAALSLHMIKYSGIAFCPVFSFMHVRAQLTPGRNAAVWAGALSVIPLITTAILFGGSRELIVRNAYFFGDPSGRMVMVEYGPWFYVHCVYSYVLMTLAFLQLLRTFFLMPKAARRPIVMMIAGIMAILVTNVVVVFNLFYYEYDLTLFGVVVMLIFFYLALGLLNTANIIITSRRRIYDTFSSMLMVLDADGKVIDSNLKAKALLTELGMKEAGAAFPDFKERWLARQNGRISKYDRNILTVEAGKKEQHYRIILRPCEEEGGVIGYFAELQEITQLYSMVRLLEESASYDKLTGLLNRNSFNERLVALSGEDALPLGIIYGDINLLKKVNDRYGHIVGDEMLRAAAAAMAGACPERAVISRIGGDEFAVLLPNSGMPELEEISRGIRERFSEYSAGEFGKAGIALGCVLKTSLTQDARALIEEADRLMYSDKNDRRRKDRP